MKVQAAFAEICHRRARGADPGEDDVACVIQYLRIIGDEARLTQKFQRPGDAGQVSRLIIPDTDHSTPPYFIPCQEARVSSSLSIALRTASLFLAHSGPRKISR